MKRLANKLNSYKDARFHPYAFIDAANSEMSAHQQHHSGATSSSSNTGISGTIDDILADFGFDSSHYVKMDFNKENYVWDNTVSLIKLYFSLLYYYTFDILNALVCKQY